MPCIPIEGGYVCGSQDGKISPAAQKEIAEFRRYLEARNRGETWSSFDAWKAAQSKRKDGSDD